MSGSQALGPAAQPQQPVQIGAPKETSAKFYLIPFALLALAGGGLAVAGKYFNISPDALIAVGSTAILATMVASIVLRLKSKLWEKISGDGKEKFYQIAVIVAMATLVVGIASIPSLHVNLLQRTVNMISHNGVHEWITFGAGSLVTTLGIGSAAYIFHRRNKEEDAKGAP